MVLGLTAATTRPDKLTELKGAACENKRACKHFVAVCYFVLTCDNERCSDIS